jgi:hypothetical protein
MRHLVTLAFVCTGCNALYGIQATQLIDAAPAGEQDSEPPPPDRDRDGIADSIDPCLASISDTLGDWDGDGLISTEDPCPFGFDETDADGDGLCVEADPLPLAPGDRMRCPMAFNNIRLNSEAWLPRGDAAVWQLLLAGRLGGRGTGTLVAVESFEAPVSTGYVAQVRANPRVDTAAPGGVTIWLRTTDTAATTDVGCEVRGNETSTTVRLVGGAAPTAMSTVTQPLSTLVRLHAVIEPGVTGRRNVLCTAHWSSASTTVTDELVLPPGRFGFSLENVTGFLQTLGVTERDDAPLL